MDLLKYKLKINHSTLCVRLPKDQCHTQLKVFTDQYNWISVSLKAKKCARQEKRGSAGGFGKGNSRGGAGSWIDSVRGPQAVVFSAAAKSAPFMEKGGLKIPKL